MSFARWNRLPALGAGLLVLACGGDGGAGTGPCTPGLATQLVKSGDQQNGYFSNPLPAPYQVTAQDASGCPVPGVVVNWAPANPASGSVSPLQSTTTSSGVAMTTHTLGPSATTQTVTATPTAPGLQAVTFTAIASAPPTTADVTVGPGSATTFSPRDVVIKTGGTVTWTWVNVTLPEGHNVTYGMQDVSAGRVNSATKATGSHTNTITSVGTYSYTCTLHPGMNGSVTVVN